MPMNVRLRGRLLVFPLLFLALATGGCDILGSGNDNTLLEQLERNERRWQELGPDNYTMVMRITTLQDEIPLAAVVTVRNGIITDLSDPDTEEPVSNESRAYLPVEGVFDLIRDAIAQRPASIQVRYDGELGFPDHVEIDYDFRRLDDDVLITITNLRPAT
jgi:hypothetical protein